jgi:hypothetical protein
MMSTRAAGTPWGSFLRGLPADASSAQWMHEKESLGAGVGHPARVSGLEFREKQVRAHPDRLVFVMRDQTAWV